MSKVLAYLNGRYVEEEEARITPFDRGFLLGDGLFETMRAYSGIPFALERHLDRLLEGVHLLQMMGLRPRHELEEAVRELLFINDLRDAKIRMTVSRGPEQGKPTIFITSEPFDGYPLELYKDGMTAITVSGYRCGYMKLLKVKTTSHIESVMASAEAALAGADEAILLNERDEAVEGSKSNVFVVSDGRISTPPISAGALPGVTRSLVIDLTARSGMPLDEDRVSRNALFSADEIFCTGSLMEIMPVRAVDGTPIGTEIPGPVTLAIMQAYKDLVDSYVQDKRETQPRTADRRKSHKL